MGRIHAGSMPVPGRMPAGPAGKDISARAVNLLNENPSHVALGKILQGHPKHS